ncbi:hypothetical protein NC651_001986 [Populus alba x Populus x berolinensis]|nr:hypothetical protein NC651_001986 [Populus alba x Populus x berolinensis]
MDLLIPISKRLQLLVRKPFPALNLLNMGKMFFLIICRQGLNYDPLTSYISPRPFLRYKPNRHRDIVLRRENVAREETSTCSRGSLESKNDKDVEDDLGILLWLMLLKKMMWRRKGK